ISPKASHEEAPVPPKAKVKAKALKAKKAVMKDVPSHKKRKKKRRKMIYTSPTFLLPKRRQLPKQPKHPGKSAPRGNKLDHYAIIKFPLTTESAMKTEDHNALFMADVKADKHQIKRAVEKLYRPDGEKKVYVQLVPDNDALDVVNKMESS
uniref:Large ribosomal subunit protein uL23 N-terminal domain-containing protein n=1 Tax=Myotis lucifugus TaxID=59463 RepID=G1PZF5_MYOLU